MVFAPAELSSDGFLGGRLSIRQPRRGYRAATDPVLLAASVAATPGQSVLELGCGAGVALLCLGCRVPGLALAGVELQADYAALARENAAANRIAAEIHHADLTALPEAFRARVFDHVILNPPWFAQGAASAAPDPGKDRANREQTPLADWLDVALRRLRPGGGLWLVQRTERLPEVLAALSGRAGDIRLLPLAARRDRPAGRFLLAARKGRKGAFRLLAPLVLHRGAAHGTDGDDFTESAAAVLREGGALDLE